jgi:hypothetical protein
LAFFSFFVLGWFFYPQWLLARGVLVPVAISFSNHRASASRQFGIFVFAMPALIN